MELVTKNRDRIKDDTNDNLQNGLIDAILNGQPLDGVLKVNQAILLHDALQVKVNSALKGNQRDLVDGRKEDLATVARAGAAGAAGRAAARAARVAEVKGVAAAVGRHFQGDRGVREIKGKEWKQ